MSIQHVKRQNVKRIPSAILAVVLSMLLTGCFVTPGKFDSSLELNNDNSFAFTYTGEIFFLGLSQMAMLGETGADSEFSYSPCYNEDGTDERFCSESELAQQKTDWEAEAGMRNASQASKAKQMAALLGGVDPTDPDAGNQMAAKLARQRGWNKVEYVGDGIFNVDFAINGQLTHDIVFPIIERVPVPSSFVQVILRDDNQVRIIAPGFAASEAGNPMATGLLGGMMSGMAGSLSDESNDDGNGEATVESMPGLPAIQGTFTIVTNGQILANNTDEGPTSGTAGQRLTWDVSPQTKAAPTALIKLGN